MSDAKKCPKCGGEMIEGEFMKNNPKLTILPKKVFAAMRGPFPFGAMAVDS